MPEENSETNQQDTKDVSIDELKAQHATESQKLHSESANYRTQRNSALRRLNALEQVVKGHNIDVSSITDDSVKHLTIEDGKVVDNFTYTPPQLSKPSNQNSHRKQGGIGEDLSLDSIAKMSPDQINQNWDKISQVLAQ